MHVGLRQIEWTYSIYFCLRRAFIIICPLTFFLNDRFKKMFLINMYSYPNEFAAEKVHVPIVMPHHYILLPNHAQSQGSQLLENLPLVIGQRNLFPMPKDSGALFIMYNCTFLSS